MTPTEISPPRLSVTVTGNGALRRSPNQATYTYGAAVTLRPIAEPGWSFAGWSGPDADVLDHNQDGSWTLTMDGKKELTVIFAQDRYHVTVAIDGAGAVVNTPGNPYTDGQTATLTPLPDQGWSFGGWTGPDAPFLIEGGDGTWSLAMDGHKNITAVFVQEG